MTDSAESEEFRLSDSEWQAIAVWDGWDTDADPRNWPCYADDRDAYMPLFERLAREQGYALWSQKDGPSSWWFCGVYTDVPHRTRQEPSPGTAVCRAVLAVIGHESHLDKKAN